MNEYVKALEDLRKGNKERFHNAALEWNRHANERESNLGKLLISVATVAIPASFLPFNSQSFAALLSANDRQLLIASWVVFVLSVITGIIHLTIEKKSFDSWATSENDKSACFNDAIVTDDSEKAYQAFNKMLVKSEKVPTPSEKFSRIWIIAQASLLLIGFVVVVYIFSKILLASTT